MFSRCSPYVLPSPSNDDENSGGVHMSVLNTKEARLFDVCYMLNSLIIWWSFNFQ